MIDISPNFIPEVPAKMKIVLNQINSQMSERVGGITLGGQDSKVSASGQFTLGGISKTAKPGDNLQNLIDELDELGGGTLYLAAGTYTQETALTLYDDIRIIGLGQAATTVDFNNTAANFTATGTSVYTTGTITVASGTAITGSGTSWLANVTAGQHLFLGTRWYLIAAVTGDTTLVLAEGYGDNVTLPSTYRIATPIQGVRIEGATIKNSTGTALAFTDFRKLVTDDVLLLDNNKGFVFTNFGEINAERFNLVSNTSNGGELTNGGLSDWESINPVSNGGHGIVINNVKNMTIFPTSSTSNTSDGYNITTGVNIYLFGEFSGNGGQGVECVSGCDNVTIIPSACSNNTSDGVKLTATSDNCKIELGNITGNGGYGINIAASTCDNTNISASNTFSGNTSGAINDAGVGTNIGDCVGIAITEIKRHVRMKNTSGGQLDAGDLVGTKDVAAGDEVTTYTTTGDGHIFGMVVETIANNAYGRIQTLGKTTLMKVNGDADVNIGSFITFYTTAKIGMTAGVGNSVIAIALEAYTAADSNGVIDAMLIPIRSI